MRIDIITLFPKMFDGPLGESIIKRAQEKGLVEINVHSLREFGFGERKTVDDRPYGGGVGMILMVEPVYKAIKKLKKKNTKTILLSAGGEVFKQKTAEKLSKTGHIILICGHYEGFDQRISEFVDQEISIGDYILTGGEIPAMAIIDSTVRLLPGVLTKEEAVKFESFSFKNMLEYPQYTRPEKFKGKKVPKVLLSGNHGEIEKWREQTAREKTKKIRPDLVEN